MVLTKLLPYSLNSHEVRTIVLSGCAAKSQKLACYFRLTVSAAWIGVVGFAVRAFAFAVEYIISGNMDKAGVCGAGAAARL